MVSGVLAVESDCVVLYVGLFSGREVEPIKRGGSKGEGQREGGSCDDSLELIDLDLSWIQGLLLDLSSDPSHHSILLRGHVNHQRDIVREEEGEEPQELARGFLVTSSTNDILLSLDAWSFPNKQRHHSRKRICLRQKERKEEALGSAASTSNLYHSVIDSPPPGSPSVLLR